MTKLSPSSIDHNDLLILGGTTFLGRALIDAAQARDVEVTIFNRGQTNPELFPDVEKLRGDRDGDLGALENRQWDLCIDTCGYVPRIVEQSARLLADSVGHYLFISSISAYADQSQPDADETAALGTIEDETVEEITGDTYGPLKVLCENVIAKYFAGRHAIVRPGLIVGPHDPTDRFSYWPHRIAQSGQVLAPGNPASPVQFIDVRDLAEWCIGLALARRADIFDATGPARPLSIGDLLETCREASDSRAELVWVDEAFLLDREVGPWMELPLWLPESNPNFVGFQRRNISKALSAGLKFRVLTDTLHATLDFLASRPADHQWKAGMELQKERELLAAWAER